MAQPDSGDIGVVLQGVGAIAQAMAIFGAAWLASNTFQNWRKQKLSERRIEQAERILEAVYNAKRALQFIRNPFLNGYELKKAEEALKISDGWYGVSVNRMKSATHTQLYYNRIDQTKGERETLTECLPMARAIFGNQLEVSIETLLRQFRIVEVAAEMLDFESNERDFQKKLDLDLKDYVPVDGANEINDVIALQITSIEALLLPVLRLETKT